MSERIRLTTKVAGDIAGDVYTMNNPEKEKNDPKIDEYAKGDPSAWGEDVAKDTASLPKKDESSRDKEIRQASEAIKTARHLEQKAVKCIVAAQRMLPGASNDVIEAQAADLMELPESSLSATLARQERLAHSILAAAEEVAEDVKDDEASKEAASEAQKKAREKFKAMIDEKKEKASKLAAEIKELEEDADKKASDDEDSDDAEDADKKASDDEDSDDAKDVDKKDSEDEEEEEEEEGSKEASLLDDIFSSVQASSNKKGASSLSGMVKKEASAKGDDLAALWSASTPPDVAHIFR